MRLFPLFQMKPHFCQKKTMKMMFEFRKTNVLGSEAAAVFPSLSRGSFGISKLAPWGFVTKSTTQAQSQRPKQIEAPRALDMGQRWSVPSAPSQTWSKTGSMVPGREASCFLVMQVNLRVGTAPGGVPPGSVRPMPHGFLAGWLQPSGMMCWGRGHSARPEESLDPVDPCLGRTH